MKMKLHKAGLTACALVGALALAGCGAGADQVRTNAAAGKEAPALPSQSNPHPQPPSAPNDTAPPRREVGVTDDTQAPFPQSEFGVKNQYSGPYRGKWVNIYAGGKRAAPPDDSYTAGGIRVYLGPADPASTEHVSYVGEFDAPNAPTWVKIVSVKGSQVLLERADGTHVTFDLDTKTFS
jgi:hypothetical protein